MIHLYIVYGTLKILKFYGILTPISDIPGISESVFRMFWALANGPLAYAVFMFHNSLILHHTE